MLIERVASHLQRLQCNVEMSFITFESFEISFMGLMWCLITWPNITVLNNLAILENAVKICQSIFWIYSVWIRKMSNISVDETIRAKIGYT